MSSLLINPSNKSDVKFLIKLLEKMQIQVTVVTEEDKLDYGLLKAMELAEKDDFVSEDRIMQILGKNDSQI
jgi:hypothetical protein